METTYSNQKQLLYNSSISNFTPYFNKFHQHENIDLSNESLNKSVLLTNLKEYILDNYIDNVYSGNDIVSNLSTIYGFYDVSLEHINGGHNIKLTLNDPQICVIIDNYIIRFSGEYVYTSEYITDVSNYNDENKYIMFYAQYYNNQFTINMSIYDSISQTITYGDTVRPGYFIPFVFVNGQDFYNTNQYDHVNNSYMEEKLLLPSSIYDGYLLSKNINILDGGLI
jgi:hypothetical protein